jgi:hypothetical protein
VTARPHKIVCISAYVDDLQAIDAFIEGCPGLDRSKLIRLALATVGILPAQQAIPWPRRTGTERREFFELVQSTFIVGTSALPNPVNNGRVRERKRRGKMPKPEAA